MKFLKVRWISKEAKERCKKELEEIAKLPKWACSKCQTEIQYPQDTCPFCGTKNEEGWAIVNFEGGG